MRWTMQQVEAAQRHFRSEQGQLTTFDASQFPGQSHVDTPTDGRGMRPPSYGTYGPSMLRAATVQVTPMPNVTSSPANPAQTGGGGASMLSRYAQKAISICKKGA